MPPCSLLNTNALEFVTDLMDASNTIIIMSDEHHRDLLGCSGDSIVQTPHLDRLAAGGTRFSSAYTNSPVCVPARASFATGRYAHEIGAWDSTRPHDGSVQGWASRLVEQQHDVVSIGKLHFRSSETPNGFSKELLPMHVYNGTGWLTSMLRDPPVKLGGADDMAGSIGPGETRYHRYDRNITTEACSWISNSARNPSAEPWVLYVGLIAPHFPLVAPPELFDLYHDAAIPEPRQYEQSERPRHPVLDAMRYWSDYDDFFDADKVRIARQAYYALCTFLDGNVGRIIDAVEQSGLVDSTRIIYTSDHGDNMGHRGFWGKSLMYEDSVAIPMIVNGPGIQQNAVVDTPVSLVDLHPTVTEFAGEVMHPDDADLPGTSLTTISAGASQDRSVFSEYHDWSSITGMFMLRKGAFKLIVYPGYESQLFNLALDPEERNNLATDPDHSDTLSDMHREMAKVCDVEQINTQAFADQAEKIAQLGGRDAILQTPDKAFTPPPGANVADRTEP